ncbi:MAG TPA: 16S rRNA (cytidine(1402)-2'-O)-methyltransferase [Actinomycetota bacterium]|nr:16S rRNA (cytidine(1402)-2'-O)-methyltransferase [Actinomycetota bacterium]
MSGILSVVATPIGNLDDLSPRAARTLARADIIACEDTRVTRVLLQRAVPDRGHAKLLAVHARNERARVPELVRAVAGGSHVALVTDAGMPGVSDPGHRVIEACVEAGLRVEVIPGPSAVPAALVASGLPTARFVFDGFLPRTATARRRRIESLASEERTLVLFEAPHRLVESLRALADGLGPRKAAVARELTKVHEEVVRGTLAELAGRFADHGARGEVTIVIEGARAIERPSSDPADLAGQVAAEIDAGSGKRESIAAVAARNGVPKKVVYQAVLDHAPGEGG